MAETRSCYVLDPDGDVLLVVKGSLEEMGKEMEAEEPGEQEQPSSTVDPSSPKPDSFQDALSSNQPDCEQANNSVENPVPDETQPLVVDEVKIRVSSKHLTLASRYFKSRLCGCWSEGAILESDGYVVVPVYCSNSNALFILLRIIHCQTREVPREVDLQMLCDIAVLVDFYDLYDAVEFFSSLWIDNLMSKGPAFSSTYRNNPAMEKLIVQWVWVSYAFGYRTIFRQTTERVFRNSLGPMERYGLPIPNKVVDAIENKRQEFARQILQSIDDRIETFSGDVQCCVDCHAMNLGYLIWRMKSLGLYPPPDPPYKELSYDYMWRSLIDMQGPRCGTMFHGKNTLVVHKCQFMDKTKGLLRTLEARVVGLKLDTCRPGSRPIHN